MNTAFSNATGYRTEQVGVRPSGNTITVDVPSSNPFEQDADVEIVTQLSGGVARPDRRQASLKVMHRGAKAPRTVARVGTTNVVVRPSRPARRLPGRPNAGFMPGMGDLGALPAAVRAAVMRTPMVQAYMRKHAVRSAPRTASWQSRIRGVYGLGDDMEVGLYGTVRKPDQRAAKRTMRGRVAVYRVAAKPRRRGDFLPGMGDLAGELEDRAYAAFNQYDKDAARMNRAQYDADMGKRGYWEQYIRDLDAKSAAETRAALADATKTGVSTIADLLKQQQETKRAGIAAGATKATAGAQARVAEASARGTAAMSAAEQARAAAGRPAPKSMIPWVIAGVVALAVAGAFVATRRKPAQA